MLKDKMYYSISEVAGELNVPQSTLRFWETEFKNLKPAKNRRGVRLYSKKDIELLRRIVYLTKEKSYTLEGAKKELAKKDDSKNNDEVLQTLLELKRFFVKLKEQVSGY